MPDLISPQRLRLFAPKCDASGLAPALSAACVAWSINTPRRWSHFLGQLHHESAGFTRMVENLNYSAKRLTEVWPNRFPTLASAEPYARNPEALANKTYGGRMGNTEPGDGWKYIGRGLIQLTGRANYRLYGELLGLPLEEDPNLAHWPEPAARIAAAFWSRNNLNALADKDDLTAITRKINGGTAGLADRRIQVDRAKSIFRPS
jgi:putative chitinase